MSRSRRWATPSWSAREIADDRGRGEGRRFPPGRPEDIIEALKAVEKRYPGLDRVICTTPLGTPLEDLDRFAKEVIPAWRPVRRHVSVAGGSHHSPRDPPKFVRWAE